MGLAVKAALLLLAMSLAWRLWHMAKLVKDGLDLRRRLEAWSGDPDKVDQALEGQLELAVTTLAGRLAPVGRAPGEPQEALSFVDDTLHTYREELSQLETRRDKRDRQVHRARTLNDELRGWQTALDARMADVEAKTVLLEAERVVEGPRVTKWKPPGTV